MPDEPVLSVFYCIAGGLFCNVQLVLPFGVHKEYFATIWVKSLKYPKAGEGLMDGSRIP